MKITDEDRTRINHTLTKGSRPQREALLAVTQAHPKWYRATGNGQRVTLAALYRAGVLTRRVWREGKSAADNAHEYALSDLAITAWHKEPRIDDARPVAQEARMAADIPLIEPPITPCITVESRRGMTDCSTCGVNDGTVKKLTLGWARDARLTGSTSAALCRGCRRLTIKALEDS